MRTPVVPAQTPSPSGLMMLATGVVVVAALSIAREVLMPITLAVLLSFVLAPLVELLRRIRLGQVPSALLAVLLALGVILGLSGIIGIMCPGRLCGQPQQRPVVAVTAGHILIRDQQAIREVSAHFAKPVFGEVPPKRLTAFGTPQALPA
jgi:hypothetical protein